MKSLEVYNAVLNGDHISDHDLPEATQWFRNTADRLRFLGPNFHLAWKEANRVASFLEEIYHRRLVVKGKSSVQQTE